VSWRGKHNSSRVMWRGLIQGTCFNWPGLINLGPMFVVPDPMGLMEAANLCVTLLSHFSDAIHLVLLRDESLHNPRAQYITA
jgi:hypothetical protein